jgi:ankyrin repeat protein
MIYFDSFIGAIKDGDSKKIKRLIAKGYDKRRTNCYVLKCCAVHNQLEIMKYLISIGYQPQLNGKDFVLKWAALYGHFDIVVYLINHISYDMFSEKHYIYSLKCAAKNGHLQIVKFITQYHSFDSSKIGHVLGSAVKNKHTDVVEYLIKIIDVGNQRGYCLRWSLKNEYFSMAKKFLAGNDGPLQYGNFAVNFCSEKGCMRSLKYLISLGCKPNSYALSLAAKECHFEIVKFLFSLGCDIRTIKYDALYWSVNMGYRQIYKFLILSITKKEAYAYAKHRESIVPEWGTKIFAPRIIFGKIHWKNNLLKRALSPTSMGIILTYI